MITNKDLKMCSEQLFSYSAAYQVPFYGRKKSMAEMQKLAEDLQQGEVIIVSQPLGTGKTFLVNYMINHRIINIPMGISFLTVRGIAEQPEVLERFPGEMLVVDEADIKTPVKKLIKGLEYLAEYLGKSGKKAILLGDYSLLNQDISGCLQKQVTLQEFENIDKPFFKGVLEQRFKHFLNLEEFQIEEVMESELLDYLAPEWMKSANSFRGMFSLMQQIVTDERCVRYNSEKAFLTVDMFREFLCRDGNRELNRDQKMFLEILCEFLREVHPNGAGITVGFTVNELYNLTVDKMSMDLKTFQEDILEPFAVANLLVSVGVPEYNKDSRLFVRRPAPYVPSLRLMLSAM